ncbi:nucleotidyltransferase family protein [Colwelliaceae bacterium 6441]
MTDKVVIGYETIIDLVNWLTHEQHYENTQLARLQKESTYIPLIKLANNFWLIGALCQRIREKNVWQLLPEDLTGYLSEIEKAYLSRSETIYQEAIFCCRILNKNNIRVIMLKGIAGLFNGSYKHISERFMADIDLLVSNEQLNDSFSTLQSAGFYENANEFDISPVDHHHLPPLIRANGCCYVELHRLGLKKSVSDILTTQEIWQKCVPLTIEQDMDVFQLAPSHQLILAIAHSELSDKNYDNKTFELKQLHNIYVIAHYFYQEIDWVLVKSHFIRVGHLTVLNSTLFSLLKLFNFTTPITNLIDDDAKKHVETSIEKYLSTQGELTLVSRIITLVRGYQKETILNLYGTDHYFPVLTGRLKHFKRHVKMVFEMVSSSFPKKK